MSPSLCDVGHLVEHLHVLVGDVRVGAPHRQPLDGRRVTASRHQARDTAVRPPHRAEPLVPYLPHELDRLVRVTLEVVQRPVDVRYIMHVLGKLN